MKRVSLFFVALIALAPFHTSAEPYEVNENTWQGDAIEDLHFEGEPDEHGLVWMINEPRRVGEPWYAWVYNAGDSPLFGIEATLQILSGGNWSAPGISSIGERVWPYQLDPGAVGVVSLGSVSRIQSGWTDQRIEVSDFEREHNQFWSLLTVDRFEPGDGQIAGVLVNEGRRPLSQITVRVACVADGEITGASWHVSDLKVIYPEESESFRFETKFECDKEDWIYFGGGSAT